VDPDDDMTFWTVQQYVNGTNSYAVRLLRMLAPPPATITTVTPSTVAAGQASVAVTVTGNGAGGRGFFDPGPGFPRRIAAGFSGTGVSVTSVVVNSPTSLTLVLNTTGALAGARTLTVTNPDGQTSSLASAITIGATGPNQPPIIVGAPTNKTIFDGGAGASIGPFTFTVADPDSQPVTLTATSSNTTVIPQNRVQVSLAGATGSITIGSAGRSGTSTITITASDGELTATAAFDVTVSPSSLPSAPLNLVAVVARNRVTFTWNPPASASNEPVTGYRLEGGTGPGDTIATIPIGVAQTYTLFNAPSGVFFLRLRAQTAAGLGPVSNEVQVATGEAAPPLPPLALLATAQNTAVQLAWSENPLGPVIAGYQLHAGSGPGLSDIGVLPLPPTARTFAANAPPGTYYVRVHALNAAGASVASNEAVLVAQPGTCTIPSVPLGLAASVAGRRLTLQWNAPISGAIPTGYTLEAGTTSGAANWGTFSFPASATIVSGIVPPGPYFVRVFAANACGASAASVEVSTTVQ
jgi:hypothetical protein